MSMIQTRDPGFEPETDLSAIEIAGVIFGAIRRRKWWGILVAFLSVCLTIAGALLWPPTYESTATILIEEPDVPSDLVKTTVSTFAGQRLQVITQRVMTDQNLNDMITRFGLYPTKVEDTPRSELLDKMRSNLNVQIVSADVLGITQTAQTPNNQAVQMQSRASIAFTIAFDYSDPALTQKVASRLIDLYLAENSRSRQEQASGTTQFLAQQSGQLLADVQTFQQKFTDFKSKYAGSLPEQLTVNMQILDQMQQQLTQNRRDYQSLIEKKAFLQSQLGELSPYQPMTAQGVPATPQAQLMQLELQYVDLSAKYGPKHPDVVHVQKQIDSLKAQVGITNDPLSTQAKLSQLQQQLAAALQKYGEQHPQVQQLRKQLADLNAELAKAPAATVISTPKGPPDNPVYIQLQSQLGDVTAQIQGVQSQTNDLDSQVRDLQQRVLQTPAIEAEYDSLKQQYDAAVQRYQDFKEKEADAQVAENMEQQSKSETFSVIQAPQLPDAPIKPNRLLILAAGAAFSCLLGGVAVAGLEMLDGRIYSTTGLRLVFGEGPLASVPYIVTRRERMRRRLRVLAMVLVVIGVIAGVLAIVHVMVMPLDVLVATAINRINP